LADGKVAPCAPVAAGHPFPQVPDQSSRLANQITMSAISIRQAQRADAAALFRLIVALAEYEKLEPPDAAAQTRLVEDGFGDRPRFEVWLAFIEGRSEPIGYAFLFESYSSFLAQSTLYLEDLFVLPEFRGRGAGKALLRHCVGLARDRGCGRMEWTCLDWNTKAQCVYEAMGAKRMKEWWLYRMTRPEMEAYLGREA
jgi:GNAT superfamily N-acetyltransferase